MQCSIQENKCDQRKENKQKNAALKENSLCNQTEMQCGPSAKQKYKICITKKYYTQGKYTLQPDSPQLPYSPGSHYSPDSQNSPELPGSPESHQIHQNHQIN